MGTLRAYLELSRVSNLPTVWSNVLAGCLLSGGELTPASFFLLAVALSCFYLAGMSLNDACDAEYDSERRPSRPIPSGRISPRAARIFSAMLFAAGILLLTMAPRLSGTAAGALLVAAIVAYDLHHKGNPYSVLLMALCRLLVFLVASLALTGRIPQAVLAAGGIQFLYVLAISLTARYESRRSDPFPFPLIPAMLAGISLVDGLVVAVLRSVVWLGAGVAGALLTWGGQRYFRGD
jgi:4-hydroxybenzoate polyprenyltransferase